MEIRVSKQSQDSLNADGQPLTYSGERHNLVEAEAKAASKFAKYATTVAAGALALSLMFTKDLVRMPHVSPDWLWRSWLMLTTSLGAGLFGMLNSEYLFRREIELLDKRREAEVAGLTMHHEGNLWRRITQVLNWVTIGTLIAGVFSMAVFVYLNLSVQAVE